MTEAKGENDLDKELAALESAIPTGSTRGGADPLVSRALLLVGKAVRRLDSTVQRLDSTSSHLAKVNTGLGAVILLVTIVQLIVAFWRR